MSDIYQMEEEEVVKKVVNTPLLPRIKKSQYKSVDPMYQTIFIVFSGLSTNLSLRTLDCDLILELRTD
jgi:hypothetical protein